MAEKKGKYSALGEIAKIPAQEPESHQQEEIEAKGETSLKLPVKAPKPQGKRSDPNWKQYSVLLKKESHKQACQLLREQYDGIDLSDLMQALLEQWLKTQ